MIGIDTNVLVRFLIEDEPTQHRVAVDFMAERSAADPAFVSLVALVETVWILRQVKRIDADVVDSALAALLSTDDFVFEEQEFLLKLFDESKSISSNLADHVIAHMSRRNGCARVVTFDRRAARHIPSMTLL